MDWNLSDVLIGNAVLIAQPAYPGKKPPSLEKALSPT